MPQANKVGAYLTIHIEDVGRLEYDPLVSGYPELVEDVFDLNFMWKLGVLSVTG